jgi:hypothetical protein
MSTVVAGAAGPPLRLDNAVALSTCPQPKQQQQLRMLQLRRGLILGRMSEHSGNAQQIYFPCGTPELADVVAGAIDLKDNSAGSYSKRPV